MQNRITELLSKGDFFRERLTLQEVEPVRKATSSGFVMSAKPANRHIPGYNIYDAKSNKSPNFIDEMRKALGEGTTSPMAVPAFLFWDGLVPFTTAQ